MTPDRELAQAWLFRAQRDLTTARKAAADPGPCLDTASYHCQQAAEKAVKGFLVFHGLLPEKTHDVEALIMSAIHFEPKLREWTEAGARLTPYATEFRYPGGRVDPEPEEFHEALEAAQGIYNFVLSLLPPEVHP